ncbi:MAG: hypothetical protein AB1Z98_33835 [Nannocystaceae bacterium]
MGGLACVPAQGWQRTDARACAPQSPPILCLVGGDEGLHEVRVGERVVLPGECIVGPRDRGGRLRVELFESGQAVGRASVRVGAAAQTVIRLDGDRLVVDQRQRCDRRVNLET